MNDTYAGLSSGSRRSRIVKLSLMQALYQNFSSPSWRIASEKSRRVSARWWRERRAAFPAICACEIPFRRPLAGSASAQCLDDLFRHLLGVAEEHHGVVAEEQLVLDAGIARTHATLHEQYRLSLLDIEDRHAEDRRLRVVLG